MHGLSLGMIEELQCYVMHVNLTLRSLVRPFLLICLFLLIYVPLQVSDFHTRYLNVANSQKQLHATSCNWHRSSTGESLTRGVMCSLSLHVKMSASNFFVAHRFYETLKIYLTKLFNLIIFQFTVQRNPIYR